MKLPESFLTAVADEIKSEMVKAEDYRTKAKRVLHRHGRYEPVSKAEVDEVNKQYREAAKIEAYLENIYGFLEGFDYSITIESNGTVKIQSQELDFHDYERKYSEYGEVDNND